MRLEVSTALRLGLTVGVLGAYTTFSTFSTFTSSPASRAPRLRVVTLDLLNDGEWRTAGLYVLASVAGALAAAWAGQSLARATG